jgi:hypothetical protein
MESSRARNLIGIGVCVVVVGGGLMLWDRKTYTADVRAICTAEGPAETTLVSSRTLVEGLARKRMRGNKGLALADTLKSESPDSAATELRVAARGAGVEPCPAVTSYQALAARLLLQKNAERMCGGLNPLVLTRLPRAIRFERLQDWTHTTITEPALDEWLAALGKAGSSPDDKVARLRTALSDLDIHECGVLSGLASPLDPTPGPNVRIQSAQVQSDPREGAVVDALRAKLPAFRECYDRGLAKEPALNGAIVVKFRVIESGAIDFALAQDDSTITTPAVTTCVIDAIKTAHGPAGGSKSPGGVTVAMWTAK